MTIVAIAQLRRAPSEALLERYRLVALCEIVATALDVAALSHTRLRQGTATGGLSRFTAVGGNYPPCCVDLPEVPHRFRELARRALVVPTCLLVVVLAVACGGDGEGANRDQLSPTAQRGQDLAQSLGCQSCHSVDGGGGTGPTWRGLAGSDVELADGSTVVADAAFLRRSIVDPTAEVVDGFAPLMPSFDLGDDELDSLVAYIESLTDE